ncbi:MAG: hypothetical protein JWQ98_1876 [Chlorobi bacterium]|nr:hypothetical protein [Chlorobiota bacterium]
MNILYITSSGQDNLEDAYLHGLRSAFGAQCVDYPKKDVMYRNFSARAPEEMYGRLFTIWRTLEDIPVDRTDIDARVKAGYFDRIILGSIHRTPDFFRRFQPYLDPKKTILLDGEDLNSILLSARKYPYFKRELQPKASYYYNYKLVPKFLYNRRAFHRNVLPITFAIPSEKITRGITRADKTRIFPSHIVDRELAEHPALRDAPSTGHVFSRESEYYGNIQASRFGVTTRRNGWDCLRHYEIPANGAVICFRDLTAKFPDNAPLGLDATNCVIYSTADELLRRIESMSDAEYDRLLEAGYAWVAGQTTEVKALDMLRRADELVRG